MTKNSTVASGKPLRGIASLFDDFERKELFTRYLFFLGWVEILILAICWLSTLGNGRYDQTGPVESVFPWKAYFMVSFLAPVAITFLIGVVIVGFNKYFGNLDLPADRTAATADDGGEFLDDKSGRIYKLNKMVRWFQRLPFLALLLILAVGVGFTYKLDSVLSFVGNVGEKSVKIVLISAAVLVALASIFALILIVLNFQLRKKSMEYQYKSEVAERFGLIILEDNTVLNRDGKLLVGGRKWKEQIPLLPEETSETSRPGTAGPQLPHPVDFETS